MNFFEIKQKLEAFATEVWVDELEYPPQNMFTRGNGKAAKVRSMFSLLHGRMPDHVNQVIADKLDYSLTGVPFDLDQCFHFNGKIGYGGVNDVFHLKSRNGGLSYVMKVMRGSVGDCYEKAAQQERNAREIKEKLVHSRRIILPEYRLIQPNVKGYEAVLVSVQKYKGGLRDVFTEIKPDELRVLVRDNPQLQIDIRDLVTDFRERPELLEKELDLLGPKNLSINVEIDGTYKLLFTDPNYRDKRSGLPELRDEILERVNYLDDIVSNN